MKRIINHRFFAATGPIYEAETIAYRDRVELDGGVVIDLDYVDSVYKKLKELSLLTNLVHWSSVNAGIKKDSAGYVSKLYSLDGASNEATQPTGANQPLYSSPNLVYDGTDDYLFSSATFTNQFTFISCFQTGLIGSKTMGFVSNYTGSAGVLFWLRLNGKLAIGFFRSDGSFVSAGESLITNNAKYIASGTYNKTKLSAHLNGAIFGTSTAETADIKAGLNYVEIGRYQSNHLDGNQNENVVFNVGLTDAENSEIHNIINAKNLVY